MIDGERHVTHRPHADQVLAFDLVHHHAPLLLVATPGLQDPNFAHSVVLVLFPPDGGPTGVILNRPTHLKWTEAFPDEPALARRTDPIFFGGPVRLNVLWYLFHRATPPDTALPVVEDLYLSADGKLLDQQLAAGGKVERFFIGYSGWSPAQSISCSGPPST